MGKIAGVRETTMKKPLTGRPKLHDRIGKPITRLEKKYAERRASGLSIAEAAKAVGLPEREMFSRERNLPGLTAEIEFGRGERQHVDLDKMGALQFKLLQDLDTRLTDLLMSDKLSISDIEKGYELLHKIQSDREFLMEKTKQEKVEKKPGQNMSFSALVNALPDEMKERLNKCRACRSNKPKSEFETTPDEPQARPKRRLLKSDLSVVQQGE